MNHRTDSPVESKSPSRGLRGLVMLFLFDGECFNAETQIGTLLVHIAVVARARREGLQETSIILMEVGTINWRRVSKLVPMYRKKGDLSNELTLQKLTSVP